MGEVFALLGATAAACAAASALLEKLALVRICPTVARATPERRGQGLRARGQAVVPAAWARGAGPPASATPAQRQGALDGVRVPTEARWRAYQPGSSDTTTTRPSATRPGRDAVCARAISRPGAVAEAAAFGQRLWCAAARRGVLTAREAVVLADGAPWVWPVAAAPFPGATQTGDWSHASHPRGEAAHALYGAGPPRARRWATRRVAALWAGQVPHVLRAPGNAPQREAVQEASTYDAAHRRRMCYAEYRARGLPIGSGTMERGGEPRATARRKQAGRIWPLAGVRAVAAGRTWRTRDRWAEALPLRPLRQRTGAISPVPPAILAMMIVGEAGAEIGGGRRDGLAFSGDGPLLGRPPPVGELPQPLYRRAR